ncbi:MAG: hypothetical protein JWN49_570 [Parcubacteria group bacterium]|nr:hypothetical protein [Parcubacteria group bacterium]
MHVGPVRDAGRVMGFGIAFDPAVADFAAFPIEILVGVASHRIGRSLGEVGIRVDPQHYRSRSRRGSSLRGHRNRLDRDQRCRRLR